MRKILTLIVACIALTNATNAQNFGWAVSAGSTATDFTAGVATDPSGNVIATGGFNGTVDFDPGPGVSNLSSAGSFDAFVQKLDANGNLLWAKSFGRQNTDAGDAIITDASGNIYIMGVFTDTVDFDPGPGQYKMASNNYGTMQDVFLVKLDPAGNFVWAVQRQQPNTLSTHIYVNACDLAIDNSNNLYMTYGFASNTEGNEIIVEKTGSTGTSIWTDAVYAYSYLGGMITGMAKEHSIAVDGNGNVIVGGTFSGDLKFYTIGSPIVLNSPGEEAFVFKLDNAGNFVWAQKVESGYPGFSNGYDVATDNAGNIYMGGRYSDMVDFDPGPGVHNVTAGPQFGSSMFLWKLTPSGSLGWVNSYGDDGNNYMAAVTTDAAGNVYATGKFEAGCVFNYQPYIGFSAAGYEDVFTLKVNGQGNFQWAWQAGSNSSQDFGYALAVSKDGKNVYTGGVFLASGSFDRISGNAILTSVGGLDAFIYKIGNCKPFNKTVTQTNNVLTSGATGALYQWFNCATNQPVPGATGSSFTATTNGQYKVVLSQGDCTDTSACYAVTTAGIGGNMQKNQALIYPNPTSGDITIELNNTYSQVQIEIFSAMGQVISKKQYHNVSSVNTVLNGANGIYFISVMVDGEELARTKLMKAD